MNAKCINLTSVPIILQSHHMTRSHAAALLVIALTYSVFPVSLFKSNTPLSWLLKHVACSTSWTPTSPLAQGVTLFCLSVFGQSVI